MKCLCAQRLPCPIHKGSPLKMPNVTCDHTYVVHVYHDWINDEWWATVAKDAIQVFETPRRPTKAEALIGLVGVI